MVCFRCGWMKRANRVWVMAVALTLVIGLSAGSPMAGAATIYVSTTGVDTNDGLSWATAKKTVGAGLTAAAAGDQVWVAAGTYVGSITLKTRVALYGGFAGNETQLSGRDWTINNTILDGNGMSPAVVTSPAGATADTRIDGFTIRNSVSGGNAGGISCSSSSPTITNNTITGNKATYGGGIFCSSSSPTISYNLIVGNTSANGYGGGIYCTSSSSPVISNNTIAWNTAAGSSGGLGGGIYCYGSSSPAISNNLIEGNTAPGPGAGIFCGASCSSTISNNVIRGNTSLPTTGGSNSAGAGIYGQSSASLRILNNIITANGAGTFGGGIYCSGPSTTISNNVVTGNAAGTSGGGISCRCAAAITNNTIAGNAAPNGGGIEYLTFSPTISNNIVAWNTSGVYGTSGTPTLRNNCVYNPGGYNYSGPSVGDGDISADPQLIAVEHGEVHLVAGSPCVDRGSDGAVQAGWTDMDGQPRLQGTHVDIGADEFDGTTPSFVPSVVRVSPSGNDANDGSSWSHAKRTVQAGIDAAAALGGGDVWVAAGVYSERITLQPWVRAYGGFEGTESGREQRNWMNNAAVLDGGAGGSVVSATSGGCTSVIDGFTIRNGTVATPNGYGAGIRCNTCSPRISHNTITGNVVSDGYGGGICCLGCVPTISNNTVLGNSASKGGGAIYCSSASPTILNNTLASNVTGSDGGGIYCASSSPLISNNVVAFNSSGIYASGGTPTLRNNCVYNPDGYGYSGLSAGAGDISADPKLLAADYGQTHLTPESPCVDAGDDTVAPVGEGDMDGEVRMQGAHVDIGADESGGAPLSFVPRVVRVSPLGNDANDGSSWASAKLTVQAGIDAASSTGGQVWVAAGTYSERVVLKLWVCLYGGFAGTEANLEQRDWTAHATILDGGAGGSVVSVLRGHRANCIDGFTIRNGNSNNGPGGGILCNCSSPAISNNTIAGNKGSGVHCVNGSPAISNNVLSGNSVSGVYGDNASPVINGNTITGNTWWGISCSGAPTVRDNTISRNNRGGVSCSNQTGTVIVTRNTITANTAGGGIYCSNTATILNNLIAGNSTSAGSSGGGITCAGSSVVANNVIVANSASGSVGMSGGVVCSAGSPIVTNNTIMGNVAAGGGGGGICTYSSTPVISNNIVAFNSSGIYRMSGTPTLSNNCIYNPGGYNYSGLSPGAGDISVDPQLSAIEYGRVHLKATSPCVDTGLDTAVQAGWVDMDGELRMQGAHVDIGADEFDGTTPAFVPQAVLVSLSGNDANDGSSWASAKRTVQAGIDAAASGGGEVWVASGTYSERVTLKLWVHLYGGFAGTETSRDSRDWASNVTVLDGGSIGSVVTAPAGCGLCTVDGFTICSGKDNQINCSCCWPTISHNRILGASSSHGINCDSGCVPSILNNAVMGNGRYGVYCLGSGTISNNTIMGNGSGGLTCGSATVTNNTITGNSGKGIWCFASFSPVVSNNIVAFNAIGIDASSATPSVSNNCVYNPGGTNYSGLSAGTGDISVDPKVLAAEYGEVHLTAGSPCLDAGRDDVAQPGWVDMDGEARIQGGHVDIGADEFNGTTPSYTPTIVRVSPLGDDANDGSDWTMAKRTVQGGIDAAWRSGGGDVWVAAGTYDERIVLGTWVQVFGGFEGTEERREQRDWTRRVTVLDGMGGGSVVSALGGSGPCRIDGFTIRNGTGTLQDSNTCGGGIYSSGSSLTIMNNTITGNVVSGSIAYGGGIYAAWSPAIFNNTITGNAVSGTGNGGVGSSAAGGGIYCVSSAIANNVIVGNTASGNTGCGGGIYISQSSPTLSNNTVMQNIASLGGGIYVSQGSPVVSNNVIAFNSSGLHLAGGGTPTLRNNCVHNPDGTNYIGLTAGAGDISADPLLQAMEFGQVHLKAGSPCIDTGYDAAVQAGWVDVDGEPRIQGMHVDMGADEFNGSTPPFSPVVIRVSPSGDDANDGSNWGQAKRTVQAGIHATLATGGEVWVAAGRYHERIVLAPHAYVYGGFAGTESDRNGRNWATNTTVLDGGGGGSVVCVWAGYHTNGIDGFTICNGTGAVVGSSIEGGGIFCAASPAIANNTLVGNRADNSGTYYGYGGGIYCAPFTSPTICGNTITGNVGGHGGGMYCSSFCRATISNNVISGNGGGGVYCSSASPTICNNTIVENGDGGISSGSGSPAISNNIVAFNASGISGGGGDGAQQLRLQPGRGQLHRAERRHWRHFG